MGALDFEDEHKRGSSGRSCEFGKSAAHAKTKRRRPLSSLLDEGGGMSSLKPMLGEAIAGNSGEGEVTRKD